MRSLIVVALCLGLASAAPATDLLRALLRRQVDEAKPAVSASNEKPDFALPTEEELTALSYLGYSIEFLADMAEQSPADFITYINSVSGEETVKRNLALRQQRGPKGGKGPKGPKDGGQPPRPGGPKPGKDMEDQFMKEVMEKGVYKTVVGHVKMMATMLQYAPQIFEHMIKGPDCQDCPDVPEEVMDIIMGEGSQEEKRQVAEDVSSEEVSVESDEEDKSGPKGKGPRPQGQGPMGKGPKGKGPKGPKSSEEEAVPEVDATELAKRLMSFLAKRQTAEVEPAVVEDVSSEEVSVESDEEDKSGPKGKGPKGKGPRPQGEGPMGKGPKGKGPKGPKSSEEEAVPEVDATELAKRLMSFLAKRH